MSRPTRAGRDRRRSRRSSPPASGMIAPLPNCFSMAAMAPATAFSFSFMRGHGSPLLVRSSSVDRERGTAGPRRGGRSRIAGAAGEVGDGARDAAHAGDGARRQAEARGGAFQQRVPVAVERRHRAAARATVSRAFAARAARLLALARRHDARRGSPRSDSPGSRVRELAVGQRRHVDVQVDAIEQRPRQPRRGRPSRPAAEQMQVRTVLPRWPHGQGLSAATSMKSAG